MFLHAVAQPGVTATLLPLLPNSDLNRTASDSDCIKAFGFNITSRSLMWDVETRGRSEGRGREGETENPLIGFCFWSIELVLMLK